jgi:hypothetical protein
MYKAVLTFFIVSHVTRDIDRPDILLTSHQLLLLPIHESMLGASPGFFMKQEGFAPTDYILK